MEKDHPLMRFRTWPLVSGAFSALLALVTLAAWAIFNKTEQISSRTAQVHLTYQQTDDALTEVRSGVYRASLLTRELIFESSPPSLAAIRARLGDIQSHTWSHMQRLEASLGSEQAERVRDLRAKLGAYWQSEALVLHEEARWPAGARHLLEQKAIDREGVLNLADEMDALNEANVKRQERDLKSEQREFKTFLARATAAVIVLGTLIFVFTIVRLAKLEQRSAGQRQKLEQAESELRRLSQKLVRAQEEERKAISRELHDEVGQILTGLRMELGSLAQWAAPASEMFEQRLSSIKSLVEDSLRAVRNLSLLLRPSMLDDLGLGAAVRWQAKEFSRRSGTSATIEMEGNLANVPEAQRTCLYRVIQEALTNCARHSEAKSVSIWIREEKKLISVSVQDDGKGFQTQGPVPRGLGLVGMEERVRGLQGSMLLSSQPGRGTALQVYLPLPKDFEKTNPDRPEEF